MKKVKYIFSTHWDREWYQTFEEYRIRLVELMDNVIGKMETGEFPGVFTTDGQTSFLSDYLAIKPEAFPKINALGLDGRLCMGPWFVMPDLFSVSGESLIRNLEKGIAFSVLLSGKRPSSMVLSDVFGVNSQIPQIAAQCGLKAGYLWRGINHTEHRNLLWKGSDGTILPAYRFGRNGYWQYAVQVRNGCNKVDSFDRESFFKRLGQCIDRESKVTDIDSVLLFDGMDHSDLDFEAFKALQDSKKVDCTDLDAFSELLDQQKTLITCMIEGEQIDPSVYDSEEHSVLLGTLSSRIYLKKTNRFCEDLLTGIVEPVLALAKCNGYNVQNDQLFLQRAWDLVLQCHAHDSICGSGIDEIHQDMMNRFRKAQKIGTFLAKKNLEKLSTCKQGNKIVVFSFGKPLSPFRSIQIQIPAKQATENLNLHGQYCFDLKTEQGISIPYQIVGIEKEIHGYKTYPIKSPDHFDFDRIRCIIPDCLGANQVSLVFVHATQIPCCLEVETDLVCSGSTMENNLLLVSVEQAGHISLFDKRTEQQYDGLFSFESEEELGNPFHHVTGDPPFLQKDIQCKAICSLVYVGPFESCLKIEKDFQLNDSTENQNNEKGNLHIEILVRLRSNDPILYSEITVTNSCREHRLQVLFPTGAKTDLFVSDSPFDVIEKKFGKREAFKESYEKEVETHPQSSFSSVFDGKRGLCIITDGLKEGAVLKRSDTPVALTLLRSFRKFLYSEKGEKDSLMLGTFKYQMEIIPLEKKIERSELLQESQRIILGDFSIQTSSLCKTSMRELPFLVGPGVISSLREREGRIEIRIWNPEETDIETVLDCPCSMSIETVEITDFLGDEKGKLPIIGNTVHLYLKKKQILTLSLQL
jgi:alpha-mannosidase/mannosylglycerate hydrolase